MNFVNTISIIFFSFLVSFGYNNTGIAITTTSSATTAQTTTPASGSTDLKVDKMMELIAALDGKAYLGTLNVSAKNGEPQQFIAVDSQKNVVLYLFYYRKESPHCIVVLDTVTLRQDGTILKQGIRLTREDFIAARDQVLSYH